MMTRWRWRRRSRGGRPNSAQTSLRTLRPPTVPTALFPAANARFAVGPHAVCPLVLNHLVCVYACLRRDGKVAPASETWLTALRRWYELP